MALVDGIVALSLRPDMAKRSASESAATRQLIVEAARRLFAEKGFIGARTSDIARSVRMTEGAIFHHFKDKKSLFAEVVWQMQREFAAAVAQHGSAGADAFERFMIGARASLALSQSPEYLRLVLIEAPTVLGSSNWREIDSMASLAVIEPALVSIAGKTEVADKQLKPMALQILGLLNETAFALARDDMAVTVDDIIAQLANSIHDWTSRLD